MFSHIYTSTFVQECNIVLFTYIIIIFLYFSFFNLLKSKIALYNYTIHLVSYVVLCRHFIPPCITVHPIFIYYKEKENS